MGISLSLEGEMLREKEKWYSLTFPNLDFKIFFARLSKFRRFPSCYWFVLVGKRWDLSVSKTVWPLSCMI